MESRPFLLNASWTSLNEGVVNFCSDWSSATQPRLFWGRERIPLTSLRRAPLSDFGHHSGYFVDRRRLFFVLRPERFPLLDIGKERVYVGGDFNDWGEAIGDPDWELKRQTIDGQEQFALALSPEQLDWREAQRFKFVTGTGRWLELPADSTNVTVDESGIRNYRIQPQRTGRHRFFFRTPQPLAQGGGARLIFEKKGHVESVPILPGVFLKQLGSDLPLGALVGEGETIFRLFAPRASRVQLFLYESPEQIPAQGLDLQHADELVWELSVPGVHDGWFYHYSVDGEEDSGFSHFDGSFPILDPYAKACLGPHGPGIVLGPQRYARTEARAQFQPPSWHDLVVVEVHLRDLLARAPVDLDTEARLGFRGLTAWLKEESCYLRELGVNAVELQPIQEFDTVDPAEYGWGYMPVNYFSPASHYACEPRRASQVEEFRALVQAFHEAGLAVILDVVYNHVGNPNYLQFVDKGYYFQLDANGEYLNFSGCGNTLDPDTPMARRLIIESLRHLVEAFDVDGFRFDLGELLGIDCLQEVERELKRIKPSIFLVAEPWSFRSHLGARMMETGVAAWNDGYRNFMSRYVREEGEGAELIPFMQGSREHFAAFPAQTVNYLCSHDDRVWIDKITENPDCDGSFPTANDRRRTHLAIAVLMASVGIPMLHAGDDFLYSKGGLNNTYLNGPVNALPYQRMRFFSGTHDYVRQWIRFRLSPTGQALRLDGHPEAAYFQSWSAGSAVVMLYNAQQQRPGPPLLFAVNPAFEKRRVAMGDGILERFRQWADHERLVPGGLPSARFLTGRDWLELPALSCALWVRERA